MPSIFISYRREEAGGYAGHLAADLTARFGRNSVFIDVDAIAPGIDFEKRIQQALDSCQVTLVLLGPKWLTVTDPEFGAPRIQQDNDHVRREIAAALRREDVMVIPILLEDAAMPQESELPADIASLSKRHALRLDNEDWIYRTERLCDRLAELDRVGDRDGQSGREPPSRTEKARRPRLRRRTRDVAPDRDLDWTASHKAPRHDEPSPSPRPPSASNAPGGGPDRVRPRRFPGTLLPWAIAAAAVVLVLIFALKPGAAKKASSQGSARQTTIKPPTKPSPRATNPILQALASANTSRMARRYIPTSSCTVESSTEVTCAHPASGATSVTFQTFPTLALLYQRYTSDFRSLEGAPFKENFKDCTEKQTYGEVSWNHAGQHSRTYSVQRLESGRLDPNDAIGRVFCTLSKTHGDAFYIVWTQNEGRLLGVLTGGPHDTTWDWWHGIHHSISFGSGMG